MKKTYVTPCAIEECFAANNYVAGCQKHIISNSTNNGMRCANPSHGHFGRDYFTSVWVEATNTTCRIKITKNSPKTATNGNNFQPVNGATVYGADGEQYICNGTYKRGGTTYYVPTTGDSRIIRACYGSYVNPGTYDEIMQQVLS